MRPESIEDPALFEIESDVVNIELFINVVRAAMPAFPLLVDHRRTGNLSKQLV